MESTSIIDMNHNEAREFLLQSSSYSNINLPNYFNFTKMIRQARNILDTTDLSDISFKSNAKKYVSKQEKVNYKISVNKDGKLSWRLLSLIHPMLYINLVYQITEEDNWEIIINRMQHFKENSNISAVGIPQKNNNAHQNNKTARILSWWKKFEQESIKLSLDYNYCINTDISDCYGSIYTHTISWAIHGKEKAKKARRDLILIGNVIDKELRDMQEGQTNGIPQGTVLSDFIAEIILGYADSLFTERLYECGIENYHILRYRDDYRIFSNDKNEAENILKILSETLAELNFKLNTNKTFLSQELITDAIKKDKSYWTPIRHSLYYKDNEQNRVYNITIQKHLLIIHELSRKFPNSGSIVVALKEFDEYRMENYESNNDEYQLVGIIIDIILESPRTIDIGILIVSKLISGLENEEQISIIHKCKDKFSFVANTDIHNIWLQRLSLNIINTEEYDNILCNKVMNPNDESNFIWNSSWLRKDDSNTIFDEAELIDQSILGELSQIITVEELNEDYY